MSSSDNSAVASRQTIVDGMTFHVLLDEETLSARVKELGREISEAYAGKDLAVVAVLKGSFVFLADLVRAIGTECTVDFLAVSSYGNAEKSS
ncbi:MAG: phosphoribosyltransferase family protein, partial [Myxococcota bacterium]|nr:phosphoribosyltransferase family protein [Myxococcota bacterium]